MGKRKTHPSDQIISSAGRSQAWPQSDFFWPQIHIRNVCVLSMHAEALEKHHRVKEIKGFFPAFIILPQFAAQRLLMRNSVIFLKDLSAWNVLPLLANECLLNHSHTHRTLKQRYPTAMWARNMLGYESTMSYFDMIIVLTRTTLKGLGATKQDLFSLKSCTPYFYSSLCLFLLTHFSF